MHLFCLVKTIVLKYIFQDIFTIIKKSFDNFLKFDLDFILLQIIVTKILYIFLTVLKQ